jgi:hypothetical protein
MGVAHALNSMALQTIALNGMTLKTIAHRGGLLQHKNREALSNRQGMHLF